MTKEISFLVGLKNNIEYTKQFYKNTRELYPENEIVFVSYGSIDETHKWLDSIEDENLKFYFSEENKTLSDTYNKAITLATKPYVVFLHNDMVLGRNFLRNLIKNLREKALLYYSLVEPPIFGDDDRDWKTIKDFGTDFEGFNAEQFFNFEEEKIKNAHELIETENISFFLCIEREVLLEIGALDSLFAPMFCEDDDLIFRLRLLGIKSYLVKGAMVYHFVSKTSRFSEEYKNTTRLIEEKSQRNFVRKWGFFNYSKSKAKYDIGIVLKNPTLEKVKLLEPLSTILYTDLDVLEYLNQEQKNTAFSLSDKIKKLGKIKQHDVMVYVDEIKPETEHLLKNLSDIITEKIEQKELKPPFLKRIFYQFFKPYKLNIIIHKANRLEKRLIYKIL